MSIIDTFISQSSQKLSFVQVHAIEQVKSEWPHLAWLCQIRMCFSFPLLSEALNVINGLLVVLPLTNCCHACALFPATLSFSSHRQLNKLCARSSMGAGKSIKVSFWLYFNIFARSWCWVEPGKYSHKKTIEKIPLIVLIWFLTSLRPS